jgi:hypothetical protein
MSFIIQGLNPDLFVSVFDQKQAHFNGAPIEEHIVTENPGFPCRVTLDDAQLGEIVVLLSYLHHSATTPYAQSGPIFVTKHLTAPARYIDSIPPALLRRKLSLRGYDHTGSMIDAVIVEGTGAKAAIETMFANTDVERIDAHNATRGCFAAHIVRAD